MEQFVQPKFTEAKKYLNKMLLSLIFVLVFLASLFLGKSTSIYYKTSGQNFAEKNNVKENAEEINDKCRSSIQKTRCYDDELSSVSKKHDISYSIKVLDAISELDPKSIRSCHELAHVIARTEVEKKPSEWKNVLREISLTDCTGGFLHGALEGHMANNPDFLITGSSINMVCDSLNLDKEVAGLGCFHAMGHLLLIQTNGNVYQAVVECNKVTGAALHKRDCLMGVFMEKVIGENLFLHGITKHLPVWDEEAKEETEKLCLQYKSDASIACWKQIAHIYVVLDHSDPKALYLSCQNAPSGEARKGCFLHGVGILAGGIKSDSAEIMTICHQFSQKSSYFTPCMHSLINAVLLNNNRNTSPVITLCNNTYLSSKTACFEQIITSLKLYQTDTKVLQQVCDKMEQINIFSQRCPTLTP